MVRELSGEFFDCEGKMKFCKNIREFNISVMWKLIYFVLIHLSCTIYEIFGSDIVRETGIQLGTGGEDMVLSSLSSLPHVQFLAHLSRRLTRWAYSIPMVCCLSVVVVHTFKLKYLWSQLANLDQILCVALLGWGKGCIRSWGRLDQNSGFHGNRKLPFTYNGENDVSTFSRLFFIGSFLYLQATRICIKSQTSSNFGQIGPLTTELAALERLKNFP